MDNADRIERINREDRIESHRHTETLLLPLLPSLGPSQNGKRARPAGNNDSATQELVHAAVRVWQFKSKSKSKQTLTFDDAVATVMDELKMKLGSANNPQLLQGLIESSLADEFLRVDETIEYKTCAEDLRNGIEEACATQSLTFTMP